MEESLPIPPAEETKPALTEKELAEKAEKEFQEKLATDLAMKNRWGRKRIERAIKR